MHNINTKKALRLTGHISFLLLILLSIIYYKERVVFIDTVFQFFKIVNFGKFNIEADRYSAILTQVPLLMGLKAHLSLRSLLFIYSITFTVFYYLIFILCVHVLNNIPAGMTIVFIFLLCITRSFYHISTEIHQGLVYTLLLFAVIYHPFKDNSPWIKYILIFTSIILSFFSHPVTFFIILFIFGYYLVDTLNWKNVEIYLGALILILLVLVKLLFTKSNSYESSFFSQLFNYKSFSLNPLTYISLKFLVTRSVRLYLWLFMLLTIDIVFLIKQKQVLKLRYILASFAVFLAVILITYGKGDSDVMMERAFMPLSILVALPFIKDVVLKSRDSRTSVALISLTMAVLLAGFLRLNKEGQHFRSKLGYVEQLLNRADQLQGNKFLLKNTVDVNKSILVPWSFPFTTIIVSSMEGKNKTKTIFLYNDISKYREYLTDKTDVFLGAPFWLEWKTEDLNHRYFNLPDGPYLILR